MTDRERFYITSIGDRQFAPSILGAPQYTNPVDYEAFKTTREEKEWTKKIKAAHKKLLKDAYPEGVGKRLNVPGRGLKLS